MVYLVQGKCKGCTLQHCNIPTHANTRHLTHTHTSLSLFTLSLSLSDTSFYTTLSFLIPLLNGNKTVNTVKNASINHTAEEVCAGEAKEAQATGRHSSTDQSYSEDPAEQCEVPRVCGVCDVPQ